MQKSQRAFTLIELSIVLVVIGLIVGGVLVARDLIKASEVRAQVSQIQHYQVALNTFKVKFDGYLPGDIPDPNATRFGFAARGVLKGQGDGNGVIEGLNADETAINGANSDAGEPNMVWVDLSVARMIDVSVNSATATGHIGSLGGPGSDNLRRYLPAAKLGQRNSVYVYSKLGVNYLAISEVGFYSGIYSNMGFTVNQAQQIDGKMDDGKPGSGLVQSQYVHGGGYFWVSNYPYINDSLEMPVISSAIAGSSTSCVDNGGVTNGNWIYSTAQYGGGGLSCSLSFKFQ